jgi:hypothetical protein
MKTQTKMNTETKLVEMAVKSATQDKARRLNQIEAKIETLLDGATSHPEIEKAMPKCKDFFKSLTSDGFVALLNRRTTTDQVYIALWYHYGETMHKAINKCALASPERMTLLYPLFRLYADESDTYI